MCVISCKLHSFVIAILIFVSFLFVLFNVILFSFMLSFFVGFSLCLKRILSYRCEFVLRLVISSISWDLFFECHESKSTEWVSIEKKSTHLRNLIIVINNSFFYLDIFTELKFLFWKDTILSAIIKKIKWGNKKTNIPKTVVIVISLIDSNDIRQTMR